MDRNLRDTHACFPKKLKSHASNFSLTHDIAPMSFSRKRYPDLQLLLFSSLQIGFLARTVLGDSGGLLSPRTAKPTTRNQSRLHSLLLDVFMRGGSKGVGDECSSGRYHHLQLSMNEVHVKDHVYSLYAEKLH